MSRVFTDDFVIVEHEEFAIECIGEQEMWVYDIEVDDNHNFFANDILVHNSNYIELNNVVLKNGWDSLTNPEISDKIDEFCNTHLKKVIDKAFADLFKYLNHRTPVLDMARENIGSRAIWSTAKKRYAMLVYDSEGDRYDPPKVKIQGHEAVKNSTPRAARAILREAIIKMLSLEEDQFQEYIREQEQVFFEKSFEEVAENKSVNAVTKWTTADGSILKGTPINSRAGVVYNNALRMHKVETKYQAIQEGDKVKIAYLQMPNPVNSNVIAAPYEIPSEFELDEYIDHRAMFEKFVIKPLTPFADAARWTVYEVASLDDLCVY